jgi:hypothetical protein
MVEVLHMVLHDLHTEVQVTDHLEVHTADTLEVEAVSVEEDEEVEEEDNILISINSSTRLNHLM